MNKEEMKIESDIVQFEKEERRSLFLIKWAIGLLLLIPVLGFLEIVLFNNIIAYDANKTSSEIVAILAGIIFILSTALFIFAIILVKKENREFTKK